MVSKRVVNELECELEVVNKFLYQATLDRASLRGANDDLRREVKSLYRIIDFLMDNFHPNPEAYQNDCGLYSYVLLDSDIQLEREQKRVNDAFVRMYGVDEEEPRELRLVEENT